MTDMNDKTAGILLLVLSVIALLVCLLSIVKLLNSMLHGHIAMVIQKTINADFPGKWGFLTGYVALLVGCVMTIIIQSSSVFTSTLTPLVGLGIVTVERVYPMTLGSNIGTTVTGILAAMSVRGSHINQAMQVALCHLFFNITAVAIFYPVPFMRIPIPIAKMLGRITSKYRWFAFFYLINMFLVIPGAVFGLSYAGGIYLAGIGGPLFLLFLVVTLINVLQAKRPNWLPPPLRSWNWLPHSMHSLEPIDYLISCKCILDRCEIKNTDEFDSIDDEYNRDNDDSEAVKIRAYKDISDSVL